MTPVHLRAVLVGLLAALPIAPVLAQGGTATAAGQDSQQEVERLRRDQDEILRKAGRLRELMDRLQQRYQREDKKEQVELLRQGIEHLDNTGLLKDVASIRDDLGANALSEAVRKQQEVVADIERLLNILLQRRSIDNLEQEIQQTTELASRVRELERRQAALQQQTQQAAQREPTPAERALEQQLQQLARDQAVEAQRNARDAGSRRPFLEDALQKVNDLLQQQERLEQRAQAESSGKADADHERAFDLGELLQRARELATDVRDQGRQDELTQAADQLDQALANNDPSAVQQAKDRMDALLQRAPNRPDRPANPANPEDRDWKDLGEAVRKAPAGATPAERDELKRLAETARRVGDQREQAARTDNKAAAEQLAAATRATEQKLSAEHPPADPAKAEATPQAAAAKAAAALDQAGDAAQRGETQKALEAAQEAMRQLEEARRRLRDQNPDAQQLASKMAATADSTERDLRNAPRAEDAERSAADALDRAEQALRQTAEQLDRSEPADRQAASSAPADPKESLQTSSTNLDQAKATLEQALAQAGADRKDDMAAAAQRQQQLAERAKQAQRQLDQAKQDNSINEPQQQQAQEHLGNAEQAMQQAQQALQKGEQSSAAQQQQQATRELQQAQQALQKNRTLSPEQQQAMKDLAAEQAKLEAEILRLAEEAKKRKNPEASQALDEARDAARKANRGMQQGEQDEAEQQQQRARQKLDEAARQLEEERDRYLDQRQEELLFRMKEELMAFLEQQRPMTIETQTMQKAATAEGLSRPARHKLNQFAEEEQGLAGRLESLVQALTEEGNVVYRTVLLANHDDLLEVARRLSGRNPDPSDYTTMLQGDVERRTADLLDALAREQKRREQDHEDKDQQDKGQNRFNPQRQKIVSAIADLEMLKQLEQDTQRSSDDLRTLIELRAGDGVGAAEMALVERLMHRHSEVTKLFQKIKASVDEAMQAQPGHDDGQDGQGHGK